MPPKPATAASGGARASKDKKKAARVPSQAGPDPKPGKSSGRRVKIKTTDKKPDKHALDEMLQEATPSSSSDGSIPRHIDPTKRKARPTNLKEESSDESMDEQPTTSTKRSSEAHHESEGPARKKTRKGAPPAAIETIHSALDFLAKNYKRKDEELHAAQKDLKELKAKLATMTEGHASPKNETISWKDQPSAEYIESVKKENELLHKMLDDTKLMPDDTKTEIRRLSQELEAVQREEPTMDADDFDLTPEHEKSHKAELKRLQKAYSDLREYKDEIQYELLDLLQKANKDPDYFKEKVCDDEILQKWGEMSFAISQLHLHVPPVEVTEEWFHEQPPHHSCMLDLQKTIGKNPSLGRFQLERFIWTYLHQKVFLGKNKAWGGSIGLRLTQLIQLLHGLSTLFKPSS